MKIRADRKSISIKMSEDSKNIDNVVNYINNNKAITSIHIFTYDSKELFDINFLQDIKEPARIRDLSLEDACSYDAIYRFTEIEEISITPPVDIAIDLSNFTKLKVLSTGRISGFKNLGVPKIEKYIGSDTKFYPEKINEMTNLKDLVLYPIPKNFSLIKLTNLENLEDIRLTQGNISDLNGIEKFPKLLNIWLSYCRSLENINGISQAYNLRSLWLDNCPKLTNIDEISKIKTLLRLCLKNIKKCDLSFIRNIKSLRCLDLDNCRDIQSIEFIDQLFELRTFAFCNTNIVDGNLTPCLRLKFAHTLDKRHYNLKNEQLPHDYKYSLSAGYGVI